MRSHLGVLSLLGALLLGGCGDEKSTGETDDPPRGPIEHELVEVVGETAVGGMVSPGAVPLPDVAAVQEFSTQFEDERMEASLTQVIEDLEVPEDQATYAAVVAIGCEVPETVTVTSTDTGILIEAVKPTTKPVQCLAPVTSVAVVLVDEAAGAQSALYGVGGTGVSTRGVAVGS